jgi:hypothetical protein
VFYAESLTGYVEQFTFFDSERRKLAAFARLDQGSAKEFAISSMD